MTDGYKHRIGIGSYLVWSQIVAARLAGRFVFRLLCTGQFQNRPSPPPGQIPGHLTFLKNFRQIPRYIANLDGQMPHPLELQRGSNPPASRHAKVTVETSSAKFSATTNFLFSLSKQRQIPRYNYIKRQQKKNPRGIDKSNDP